MCKNVEQTIEAMQLSEYISQWLDLLPEEDCALFVRRYWFGDEVQELAKKCGMSAAQMAQLTKKLEGFTGTERSRIMNNENIFDGITGIREDIVQKAEKYQFEKKAGKIIRKKKQVVY